MPELKDRWSNGNQFYFLGGEAWGVAGCGKTYYAGTENEILKSLENNTSSKNPNVSQSLTDEKYVRGLPTIALTRRQMTIQRHKQGKGRLG